MRVALLTNPHDEMSGAFLEKLKPSRLEETSIDVFTVRLKHRDFPLAKKIKYFVTYVGPFRYLRHVFLQRNSEHAVDAVAKRLRLPLRATTIRDLAGRLREKQYDLGLIVSLGHILPKKVFSLPYHGFYNFHPGSLLDNRGASPLFWNLYYNDDLLTVTLHEVTSKIDAGGILAVATAPIGGAGERELTIEAGRLAAEIFNEHGSSLPGLQGERMKPGAYRKRPTVFHRYLLRLRRLARR